jgi:hypothetical protein
MMGGAGVIASFSTPAESDQVMVHIIPTMIGAGIPLAASPPMVTAHRNPPTGIRKDWSAYINCVGGNGRRLGAKAAGKHSRRVRT